LSPWIERLVLLRDDPRCVDHDVRSRGLIEPVPEVRRFHRLVAAVGVDIRAIVSWTQCVPVASFIVLPRRASGSE
jgi:hypothetical protein